jgi:hypothetical protein
MLSCENSIFTSNDIYLRSSLAASFFIMIASIIYFFYIKNGSDHHEILFKIYQLFFIEFDSKDGAYVRAPIFGDKKISKKWLNSILIDTNLMNRIEIAETTFNDINNNRGFVGSMHFINITYNIKKNVNNTDIHETEAIMLEKLPSSICIKLNNKSSFLCKQSVIKTGLRREIQFYRHLFSKKKIKSILSSIGTNIVPKVFYSDSSDIFNNTCIVMENVNSRKNSLSTNVNFYFGNQIWGFTEKDIKKNRQDVAMLVNIFEQAAKMHAQFWNDKKLKEISWLKGADW